MMRYILVVLIVVTATLIADDNFYYQNGKKVSLSFVMMPTSRTNDTMRFYKNEYGTLLGVSKRLIVKFKTDVSPKSYLNKFNLKLVKSLGRDLYLLETKNVSSTIGIANKLTKLNTIKYAHPDFTKKRRRR